MYRSKAVVVLRDPCDEPVLSASQSHPRSSRESCVIVAGLLRSDTAVGFQISRGDTSHFPRRSSRAFREAITPGCGASTGRPQLGVVCITNVLTLLRSSTPTNGSPRSARGCPCPVEAHHSRSRHADVSAGVTAAVIDAALVARRWRRHQEQSPATYHISTIHTGTSQPGVLDPNDFAARLVQVWPAA
jgi:hypothetical protein